MKWTVLSMDPLEMFMHDQQNAILWTLLTIIHSNNIEIWGKPKFIKW